MSQARLGRLEMKPHMKTSELNPQRKEKGDKGKGEPKNDETGKHIKRDKTHKNQEATTFLLAHVFNIVHWKILLDLCIIQKK